tara:strand:+ start:3902 stop:4141 length:240 start_codon:yes stop_codon:yes gene_type:complete
MDIGIMQLLLGELAETRGGITRLRKMSDKFRQRIGDLTKDYEEKMRGLESCCQQIEALMQAAPDTSEPEAVPQSEEPAA